MNANEAVKTARQVLVSSVYGKLVFPAVKIWGKSLPEKVYYVSIDKENEVVYLCEDRRFAGKVEKMHLDMFKRIASFSLDMYPAQWIGNKKDEEDGYAWRH